MTMPYSTTDWEGVANGPAFSMKEKGWARAESAVPEDVERHMAQTLGGEETTLLKSMWRGGLVDIMAEDGQSQFCMTGEQSATWKAARAG